MSGVVLRCSTCGTTQSHPGECETCLEGTVRYFCGNHSPGVWLDEPTCKLCGARFGETPSPRPEPTPFVPPPPRPAGDTGRPLSRPPTPRRVEPSRPDLSGRPRRPDPEDAPAPSSLLDVLAHLVRERARRRYELEDVPPREWTTEAPRDRSVPVLGCLLRLVILVLLFIAFALGGLALLFTGRM